MKRLILLLGLLAACDTSSHPEDAGHGLPDGFATTGCTVQSDCDDGKQCHSFSCSAETHQCVYVDKACPSDGACTIGLCDESLGGACRQIAANEGMACTTSDGLTGSCQSGSCASPPRCAELGATTQIFCSNGTLSIQESSNDAAKSPSPSPTDLVDSYGCAPKEDAPEVAYLLWTNGATQDVTISLRPHLAGGGVPPDVDLDLIILEDHCAGSATCVNPALEGGGYEGVTAGTGHERVRFTAESGKKYFVVVDGKSATDLSDFHLEVESCGACQATPSTALTCNMSTPINASTAGGSDLLTSYMCHVPGITTVAAAGREQAFLFRTEGPGKQNVKAKVSGSSTPVRLFALPTNGYSGACDPAECAVQSELQDDPQIVFTAAQSASATVPSRYWLVVDTPTNTDASFGIDIDCGPACVLADQLDCFRRTTSNNTGAAMITTDVVSAWGPSDGACSGRTDLTGNELAYFFWAPSSSAPKHYRIELTSLTTGQELTLVVLDLGALSTNGCDAAAPCADTTPTGNAGASTGTYTTDTSEAKSTAVELTAPAGPEHLYGVVVDGPNDAIADFTITLTPLDGGACP